MLTQSLTSPWLCRPGGSESLIQLLNLSARLTSLPTQDSSSMLSFLAKHPLSAAEVFFSPHIHWPLLSPRLCQIEWRLAAAEAEAICLRSVKSTYNVSLNYPYSPVEVGSKAYNTDCGSRRGRLQSDISSVSLESMKRCDNRISKEHNFHHRPTL